MNKVMDNIICWCGDMGHKRNMFIKRSFTLTSRMIMIILGCVVFGLYCFIVGKKVEG